MNRPSAINYFSFLDLMCCTLGSSLLVLVLLVHDREQTGAGKTFVVLIDVFLAGEAQKPPRITVSALQGPGGSETGEKPEVRHLLVPGDRGIFFAAAPRSVAREFRIVVEQDGLPPVVGTGSIRRDAAAAAFRLTLDQFGCLNGLLTASEEVLQDWAFGSSRSSTPAQFAAAIRRNDPGFPEPSADRRLSQSLLRYYVRADPLASDSGEDIRLFCYLVARVIEARASGGPSESSIMIRAVDLYGPSGRPGASGYAPLQRALGYLRLRLGPSPVALPDLVWEGENWPWSGRLSFAPEHRKDWPAASPATDEEAASAFAQLEGRNRGDVPLVLASKGLLWTATGLIQLTPMRLQLRASWGSTPAQPFFLNEADDRVRCSVQGTTTRFEFEVLLREKEGSRSDAIEFRHYTSLGGPAS